MSNKIKLVVLALGTNTDQEMNMSIAEYLLTKLFPDIKFSEQIWTQPIGIKSDMFLNELAFANVGHGASQIEPALRNIERKCGCTRAERTKNIIKIDIDLLQLGDTKYHVNDWDRQYIKDLIEQNPYK